MAKRAAKKKATKRPTKKTATRKRTAKALNGNGASLPMVDTGQTRTIAELVPWEGNPREHPEEQIIALMGIIREVGFVRPVTVADKHMVTGHGSVEAATRIGYTALPVVDVSHLSKHQLELLVVADNKLPELSYWNRDKLKPMVERLHAQDYDLAIAGFDPAELEFRDWDAEMPITDKTNPHNRASESKVTVMCPTRHHDDVLAAVHEAVTDLDLDGVRVK